MIEGRSFEGRFAFNGDMVLGAARMLVTMAQEMNARLAEAEAFRKKKDKAAALRLAMDHYPAMGSLYFFLTSDSEGSAAFIEQVSTTVRETVTVPMLESEEVDQARATVIDLLCAGITGARQGGKATDDDRRGGAAEGREKMRRMMGAMVNDGSDLGAGAEWLESDRARSTREKRLDELWARACCGQRPGGHQ